MPSWGYQHILKLTCWPLAFTSHKFKQKTKKGLELVSLPDFLHDFWRKNSSCYNLLPDQVSLYWPGSDVIGFEINIVFLIKPFFLYDEKIKTKI